jgi:hypothetical protein
LNATSDLNDELSDFAAEIGRRYDQAEAERFLRLYAEEVLALERDMLSSPVATTHSLFGEGRWSASGNSTTPARSVRSGMLLIEHHRPPAKAAMWIMLVAIIGVLLAADWRSISIFR